MTRLGMYQIALRGLRELEQGMPDYPDSFSTKQLGKGAAVQERSRFR